MGFQVICDILLCNDRYYVHSLSALADRSSRATDAGIRFGFRTWGFWARLAVPGSICVLEIVEMYIRSLASRGQSISI